MERFAVNMIQEVPDSGFGSAPLMGSRSHPHHPAGG
jgi:hypothetical protein